MNKEGGSGAVNLTEGNLKKQLVKLATPIIGTSFIQIAYTFTDIAWVGHLGSRAIAAISAIGVVMWFVWSLGITVKIGAEVCVSQALGAKNMQRARSYVAHTMTIALALGLLITLLLFVFGRSIIGFYHFESSVASIARNYLYIVSPVLAMTFGSLALTGGYNGSGQSNIPFKVNAIGLVANMILDPLLIYVLKMGTEGAAVATFVAQSCVFLLFLREIRYGKPLIARDISLLTRLKKIETTKIIKIGFPVSALNALMAMVTFVMGSITSRIGGHIGVAVLNAGGQLEAVTWNTSQGFSTALATYVGQNFAAQKKQRIFAGFRFIMSIALCLGVAATIFYVFWGEDFFRIIIPDKATYTEAGRYYRIVGLSQLFSMMEITIQGLYYGTGRSLTPSLISIGGNTLRIPTALLLIGMGLGLSGIWWTISISSILKSIVILATLPPLIRYISKKTT